MSTLITTPTAFDFAILAVLALSIIVSFFRGFLREMIALITWILAIVLALKFAPVLSNQLTKVIHSANLRYIIAFIIILLIILLVGFLIGSLFKLFAFATGMGFFDKLLGVVFGFARGVLLVSLIILIIQLTANSQATWYQKSTLAPHFQPLVNLLKKYLPKDLKSVKQWVNRQHNAENRYITRFRNNRKTTTNSWAD